MCVAPTAMKTDSAISLMTTMMLFAVALSRAPRSSSHGMTITIAHAGRRARAAEQKEREHERRAGARPNDFAIGADLSRRRRADRAEDPGANHRAYREHDQIARAERSFQAVKAVRFLDELRDRLALEELRHVARLYLAGCWLLVAGPDYDDDRVRRYAVSLDATTSPPRPSNATPTRPGPASVSCGSPSGGTRYSPLEPASASTTYSAPDESNANP